MSFVRFVTTILDFYMFLIIAFCLMSWFPKREGSLSADIEGALATLVLPYLNFFRKVVPSFGGIDFSPVFAILVLQAVERLLFRL